MDTENNIRKTLVEDDIESNTEEGTEVRQEKFTSEDILNILNMLSGDDRDILLMVYSFRDIKNLLNYEETYHKYIKDVLAEVNKYNVLMSIVNNLRAMSMVYDTKSYKMKKIINECRSMDKEERTALGISIMTGAAVENEKDMILNE